MDCQLCGKKPATIHYTELSAGSAVEYHICQECAQAKGLFKPSGGKAKFSVSDFLTTMSSTNGSAEAAESGRCPRCGQTFAEFRETGRLGCSECYTAFADLLRPLLRRVHGSTRHVGKRPSGAPSPDGEKVAELVRLREALRRALEREDFEQCADLRDKIRKVEGTPEPS
jgi:protein arginine kinase activator